MKITNASNIFKIAKKEQEKMEPQIVKHNKKLDRHNKRIARETIRSFPKRIAESRMDYPGKEWIQMDLMIRPGLFREDYNITDKRRLKIMEHIRNEGFDVKESGDSLYFYIKDPNVKSCEETSSVVIDL